MEKRFYFADAFWFRVPLELLALSVAVFAFLSLYPALTSVSGRDHDRALFGLTALAGFMVAATVFTVAVDDSYVAIDADHVDVRFEAFFGARIPLADIVACVWSIRAHAGDIAWDWRRTSSIESPAATAARLSRSSSHARR